MTIPIFESMSTKVQRDVHNYHTSAVHLISFIALIYCTQFCYFGGPKWLYYFSIFLVYLHAEASKQLSGSQEMMSRLQRELNGKLAELQEKLVERDASLAQKTAVVDENTTDLANLQRAMQVQIL